MISVRNVSLAGRLNEVSCELSGGRFVHLIGANGAGKSSLLTLLAGLISPDKGEIRLNERLLDDYLPVELAVFRCFQKQNQDSQFALKVEEALSFFAAGTGVPTQLEQALEVKQFMHRQLNNLSGGENKRVHLTRVLLQVWPAIEQGQAVILLDEPLQGLDFRHQHLLFGLLQRLAEKGNLVVCSHHDLNLCMQYADDVLMVQKGRLQHTGNSQEVMTVDNLQRLFECGVNAVPDQNNNTLFQTFLDN